MSLIETPNYHLADAGRCLRHFRLDVGTRELNEAELKILEWIKDFSTMALEDRT
jgi:hypothetical protein